MSSHLCSLRRANLYTLIYLKQLSPLNSNTLHGLEPIAIFNSIMRSLNGTYNMTVLFTNRIYSHEGVYIDVETDCPKSALLTMGNLEDKADLAGGSSQCDQICPFSPTDWDSKVSKYDHSGTVSLTGTMIMDEKRNTDNEGLRRRY